MLKTNKHPDIIHCHDWQTGLAPVLLYELYQSLGMTHPRVCYTLHNLQHQGVTGEHVLRATGLNRHSHFYQRERLQDNFNPSAINLMKGGIVYSNFVTTVSPSMRRKSFIRHKVRGWATRSTYIGRSWAAF
jgi:starch synthase